MQGAQEGFLSQRGHGALCSTATAAAHTNSSELSLASPIRKKAESSGAWTENGLCKYQNFLVFKVSFVTEFQNKWSHRTINILCLGSVGSGSCSPSHPFLRWNEHLWGFQIRWDFYSICCKVKKSPNRKFCLNQDLALHYNNYPASTAMCTDWTASKYPSQCMEQFPDTRNGRGTSWVMPTTINLNPAHLSNVPGKSTGPSWKWEGQGRHRPDLPP